MPFNENAQRLAHPAGMPVLQTASQRRVLVVDDNTELGRSMVTILEVEGFSARHVATGLDAVLMTRRWQPQVIVLDLSMPQGNGWEVASVLRDGLAPDCFLIAHSALLHEPADIERCRQAGFDACMPKPCDIDALLSMLEDFFGTGSMFRPANGTLIR
ncbi:response regulator [Pararobbsia alpina]|uniref:response regulator n=1 Tax=Pararobbsia alpina TaxID=621374 RepID=UPI0039A531E7